MQELTACERPMKGSSGDGIMNCDSLRPINKSHRKNS